MAITPLQNKLSTTGANAVLGEYRGAETALRYGNAREELQSFQKGCAVYDLGFRARISLTGGDRTRWLNGMVTNNIRDLAAGRGVYSFLLNPQGKILADLYAFHRGEQLVVETDCSQIESMLATFDHYIIMDDVEVKNISSGQTTLGVAGRDARKILDAAGIEVRDMQTLEVMTPRCVCECDCVECTVVRCDDAADESYEIWLDGKDVLKTWQALRAAGAMPAGSEALETHRIAAGIPLYGVDIRDRDLAQETGQERALNFNKGCYVGQEIVERIRSRGQVHRRLSGFLIEGEAPVAAGARIVSGEKEVGEITSAAVAPAASGAQTVALGYIRREVGTPGREVTIEGKSARVIELPLQKNVRARTPDSAMLHGV